MLLLIIDSDISRAEWNRRDAVVSRRSRRVSSERLSGWFPTAGQDSLRNVTCNPCRASGGVVGFLRHVTQLHPFLLLFCLNSFKYRGKITNNQRKITIFAISFNKSWISSRLDQSCRHVGARCSENWELLVFMGNIKIIKGVFDTKTSERRPLVQGHDIGLWWFKDTGV